MTRSFSLRAAGEAVRSFSLRAAGEAMRSFSLRALESVTRSFSRWEVAATRSFSLAPEWSEATAAPEAAPKASVAMAAVATRRRAMSFMDVFSSPGGGWSAGAVTTRSPRCRVGTFSAVTA